MSRLDSKTMIDKFLDSSDWRVAENSNAPKSIGALTKHVAAKVYKDYWLTEVYDKVNPEINKAYHEGYIHIHDLGGGLTLYCCGYSLKEILKKGVRGVPNIPVSSPAKHLDSALSHICNLTSVFQNEIAGAVAFSSLDTLMAPFIRKDHLDYTQVYQKVQNFIYAINSNSRAGAEPAFSNVTLDIKVPRDLYDQEVEIAGEPQGYKYGDLQDEVDLFNEVLLDIYLHGDCEGKPFSYPIPTYSITKDFDWDSKIADKLFELAGKFGTPYFSNFVNSDLDPSDVRSMCPIPGDTLIDIKETIESDVQTVPLRTLLDRKVYVQYRGEWKLSRGIKVGEQRVVSIKDDRGTYRLGEFHQHPVVRDDKVITISAGQLRPGDYSIYEDDGAEVRSLITEVSIGETSDDLFCVEVLEAESDAQRLFTLHSGLVTHNCRLRLDLRELTRRNGGLFGSGDSTGSIGVVTLNLPRIAYEARQSSTDREEQLDNFFRELDHYMSIARESLQIKRKYLNEVILPLKLLPAFSEYVGTTQNHFSTIGIIGMNEMCMNLLGVPITDPDGKKFALDVSDHIRSKLSDWQEQDETVLWNYEATPAEATSFRLALIDKKKYPDIYTQGPDDAPYYTNSCHAPVKTRWTMKDLFDHQDLLQTKFTGGTVVHLYCGGPMTGDQAKQLIHTITDNYTLPYVSISPVVTLCPTHGYLDHPADVCPYCGQSTNKMQRITGYVRDTRFWNPGKKSEFSDRNQFQDFMI